MPGASKNTYTRVRWGTYFMDSNRRLTPVAPRPTKIHRPESQPKVGGTLRAPILIVTPTGQVEHERGVVVIGRAESARIVLNDPLVSREHARLIVQPDGQVLVEDLNSTNGVLVNGVRLTRPSAGLVDGDRLLLGTTEVSVFAARASARIRTPQVLGSMRQSPSSGRIPVVGAVDRPPQRASGVTQRADAGELVGRLAERLHDSGRSEDAVRVLSEHLKSMLVGAAAGLDVPEDVLELATRYALRLHGWTQKGHWLDQAMELHLACKRLPTAATLDALEAVWTDARDVDRKLVTYLSSVLSALPGPLRPEEQARLLRLSRLAKRS